MKNQERSKIVKKRIILGIISGILSAIISIPIIYFYVSTNKLAGFLYVLYVPAITLLLPFFLIRIIYPLPEDQED